jgi:hypothetical protein
VVATATTSLRDDEAGPAAGLKCVRYARNPGLSLAAMGIFMIAKNVAHPRCAKPFAIMSLQRRRRAASLLMLLKLLKVLPGLTPGQARGESGAGRARGRGGHGAKTGQARRADGAGTRRWPGAGLVVNSGANRVPGDLRDRS